MEARPEKIYYHEHGMNSREFLNLYFEPESVFRNEMGFVMEKLHRALAPGQIKGETLIDISIGSFVHHLFEISEYFKEIIILKLSESCIMELTKWVNTRTGAFNWNHASKHVTELQGTSLQEQEIEEKLKEKMNRIVKFDFRKENLTDPELLPQADCVVTAWLLGAVSCDQQDYVSNLRKIIKLLKPRGNLVMIALLKTSYYTVGNVKMSGLAFDDNFVKKTLTDEGFVIGFCEIFDRKVKSDHVDYKQVMVLTAVKGNILDV